MNILLIEDELAKAEELQEFFNSRYKLCVFHNARSVRSGVDALRARLSIDLMILDMSLPTFDISDAESGGSPQGFGGVEILRYLQKQGGRTPVVVVTGFEAFALGDKIVNIDELRRRFSSDYPENFRGAIYYNVMLTSWAEELEACISTIGLDG